jgi:hypothetical protein
MAVLTAVAVLAGVMVVGGFAVPARAAGPFEPIIGDVTGDRVPDVVVLTAIPALRAAGAAPSLNCAAEVRPGLPNGGVGEPAMYTYMTLPREQPCPDMGAAADVNGAGVDELMLTWFAGPPPAAPDSMVTVKDFHVVAVTNALYQPSYVDRGHFNGDDLEDIYEWSDQGEGYATFLSDGDGTFTPGPEKYCAKPLQSPTVRDFNHNGPQDALISYIENCADNSSGVVVVLDNGSVQQLQNDPDGLTSWTARVVHANEDGNPDILTINQQTGQQQYFINTGTGAFVLAPKAVPDHATVSNSRPTTIPVLANDYATRDVTVSITRKPRYGQVRVTSAGTVIYTPDSRHGGSDWFVYQLSERGRTSSAGVGITFTTR